MAETTKRNLLKVLHYDCRQSVGCKRLKDGGKTMDTSDLELKISDRTAKIVVMGQGYVGLPLAMRATEVGYHVVGYEQSEDRVRMLQAGRSYIEDVEDETLKNALKQGYVPTSESQDLEAFDIAVISVPTPLREGYPDLGYVESAGRDLATHLRPGACVILESTTFPGTTNDILVPLLASGSGLDPDQFFAGYSPERIDPGNSDFGLVNTPKVVSGSSDEALVIVNSFFMSIVDSTVPVNTCDEAELVKLLENTFRHVNIALVNELAMFARDLNVDIWRVIDAATTKPFGFMRFTPGPGVGGHCLPIDPSYLAWRVKQRLGRSFRFVELANDINEHMPNYVHARIVSLLNKNHAAINGSRILLLGLAYKRSTSDWRESPSIQLLKLLEASGAHVYSCDPHVRDEDSINVGKQKVDFNETELSSSDLVVIMVDHPEFDPDLLAIAAPLVLDTKNVMKGLEFRGETL